ncbi:hypothetical protein J437_LFUL000116 [Ladona fulva]|uniref:Uncharacterized protein n=1 Tax=Ladona fulva TaxID=123851 RepID=A0A8K0K4C1_LADFU|nr:hypothetical protein J437_LFUL000116 [Ladona fulva]
MNSPTTAFLILLGIHLCIAEYHKCCPGDNVYSRRLKSCASPDGDLPTINCTVGRYVLDPKKYPIDTYVVLDDGQLSIGEKGNTYTILPDGFCITHIDEHENDTLREVAIVCFADEEEVVERGMDTRIYFIVLLVISIIFLFVTLLIYLLISELRDLQGKCIMSTVMSLMLAYVALAGIQLRGHLMQDTACLFSGELYVYTSLGRKGSSPNQLSINCQ